jgi:hypothetical protein
MGGRKNEFAVLANKAYLFREHGILRPTTRPAQPRAGIFVPGGRVSYITRRPRPVRADDDYWYETGGPDHITVHEPEDGPVFTGLYDAHGNELCRMTDRLPMGFRVK